MTIIDCTAGKQAGRIRRCWRLAATVGLVTVSSLAWSHTHVIATHPADGDVLQEPPERIAVEFDSPLRMTRFEVTDPRGTVELNEDTIGAMAEQHEGVPVTPLAPGKYRVEWRGLADDGHSMSGDFGFTIDD